MNHDVCGPPRSAGRRSGQTVPTRSGRWTPPMSGAVRWLGGASAPTCWTSSPGNGSPTGSVRWPLPTSPSRHRWRRSPSPSQTAQSSHSNATTAPSMQARSSGRPPPVWASIPTSSASTRRSRTATWNGSTARSSASTSGSTTSQTIRRPRRSYPMHSGTTTVPGCTRHSSTSRRTSSLHHGRQSRNEGSGSVKSCEKRSSFLGPTPRQRVLCPHAISSVLGVSENIPDTFCCYGSPRKPVLCSHGIVHL